MIYLSVKCDCFCLLCYKFFIFLLKMKIKIKYFFQVSNLSCKNRLNCKWVLLFLALYVVSIQLTMLALRLLIFSNWVVSQLFCCALSIFALCSALSSTSFSFSSSFRSLFFFAWSISFSADRLCFSYLFCRCSISFSFLEI